MDRLWRDAAIRGDPLKLAELLSNGTEIDSRDRCGQTALMLAAVRGNTEAVRLLADRGARLDVRAKYSLTALMLAIINAHEETADALIDAGADVTALGSGAPGFAGKAAYHLALERGLSEVAQRIAAE